MYINKTRTHALYKESIKKTKIGGRVYTISPLSSSSSVRRTSSHEFLRLSCKQHKQKKRMLHSCVCTYTTTKER